MRSAWKATGAVLAATLAFAGVESCSAGGDAQTGTMVCAPGQQINCGCPGGAQGTQTCSTDGSGYGACHCPDAGGGAQAGSGGSGATGAGGVAGSGGTQAGGGGAGPGGGGAGPGGSGGTGGGTSDCAGDAFPPNVPDRPACSGEGTACEAGTGTCVSSRCFLNCVNNDCANPYQCVTVNGANVCALLTSCGSRCNVAKAALCLSPATCITIEGDTFGMCLPECVSNACPYDAGGYLMGCIFEAGADWFCGFDCDSTTCPAEYDCVTVGQDKRCEPKQL